jgi:hypothetical protein
MHAKFAVDARGNIVKNSNNITGLNSDYQRGTTIETLEALCQYEPDLMDFLAQAKRGKVGRPHKNDKPREYAVDARGNIVKNLDNVKNKSANWAQGNSAEYAYNKRDYPCPASRRAISR